MCKVAIFDISVDVVIAIESQISAIPEPVFSHHFQQRTLLHKKTLLNLQQQTVWKYLILDI